MQAFRLSMPHHRRTFERTIFFATSFPGQRTLRSWTWSRISIKTSVGDETRLATQHYWTRDWHIKHFFSTLKTGVGTASRQWHVLRHNSKHFMAHQAHFKRDSSNLIRNQKSKLGVFVLSGLLLRRSIPWPLCMLYNHCACCATGKMDVREPHSAKA